MIRALLLALTLVSSPVWATVDGWPALYDVVGVASDDVLNVRAGPNAQAEIIGTLEHDAAAIEVIRPDEEFEWGLINQGERTGWISLNFVIPQPEQWYGSIPNLTQCFGTEPFWSLTRRAGMLEFERPDARRIAVDEAYFIGSLNRRDRFTTAGSSIAQGLTATIATEACSDGMSDRAYGLSVDIILEDAFDAALYSGCCSIAPLAE